MSDKVKVVEGGKVPQGPPPCCHKGDAVVLGGYTIYAAGGLHVSFEELFHAGYDYYVMLRDEKVPHDVPFGQMSGKAIYLPIRDFDTVHQSGWVAWKRAIAHVAAELTAGKRIIAFCAGGHGRTGLFLASLLAYMEPDVDDPVAKLRHRYCHKAVETPAQEAQVMRLLRETRAAHGAQSS
jgi:hypothetical protein